MKKLLLTTLIVIIFLSGFISNTVYSNIVANNGQLPLSYISKLRERDTPQDILKEDQIIVTKDNIVINIENAGWSRYADTHSMEPLISSKANGIEIVPECEAIKPGDIIVYDASWTSGLIVHRVISIEEDENGLFFRLKGDNSPVIDPEKVRCSQVKYQLIGVLY